MAEIERTTSLLRLSSLVLTAEQSWTPNSGWLSRLGWVEGTPSRALIPPMTVAICEHIQRRYPFTGLRYCLRSEFSPCLTHFGCKMFTTLISSCFPARCLPSYGVYYSYPLCEWYTKVSLFYFYLLSLAKSWFHLFLSSSCLYDPSAFAALEFCSNQLIARSLISLRWCCVQASLKDSYDMDVVAFSGSGISLLVP